MTKPLTESLSEIEKRAIRARDIRSDDFDHDTERLANWSMLELDTFSCVTIPALLRVIRKLIEQRNEFAQDAYFGNTFNEAMSPLNRELAELLEGEK